MSVASVGDSISLLLPPWPGRYSAFHFDDTTLPKEGGEIPPPKGCGVLCKPTRLYSCIANSARLPTNPLWNDDPERDPRRVFRF